MNIERWSTRAPLTVGFGERWNDWVSRAPLANFSLRLDHARWDAENGRHTVLVLAQHRERSMVIALREAGDMLECGWPWRWQAAMCDADAAQGPTPTPDECMLLFEAAQSAASGTRLRMHLPHPPSHRVPSFRSGATLIQRIDVSDSELLDSMEADRRRLYRRALRMGFTVRRGGQPDDAAAYATLDRHALAQRGGGQRETRCDVPAEDAWREWQCPWMRLLLSEREGSVEACLGDGTAPGAMVEGRLAITSADGRSSGVMCFLCHEEARLHRDEGHRWLNPGGDTLFKREVAGRLGTRLIMHAWLGGGARFTLTNRSNALISGTRPALASWLSTLRRSVPALKSRRPAQGIKRPSTPAAGRAQVATVRGGKGTLEERVWSSETALDAGFEREWVRRLEASGRAPYSMGLDWLRSESKYGRASEAVLLDAADFHAAVVLHRNAEQWACGRPRSAHVLLEHPADSPVGLDGHTLHRVEGFLRARANLHPILFSIPRVRGGPKGEVTAQTMVQSLCLEDGELWAGLTDECRERIESTRAGGWSVRLASRARDWDEFSIAQTRSAELAAGSREVGRRQLPDLRDPWFESERPWQWLLLVEREGEIHGGAGYAWSPRGFAKCITHVSSAECRRDGANTLVAWHALLHSRDAGCRWMNWGGATGFDRQFGGEVVDFQHLIIDAQ